MNHPLRFGGSDKPRGSPALGGPRLNPLRILCDSERGILLGLLVERGVLGGEALPVLPLGF